ncbi:Molybdopterin-guanine dinucleotide biosynthesis protein A-like [Frankia casuarinae]|uniref:Molybdopterin-guanine dinucleotide biosynthesis protein A-like n=1 Tax=Frankia casuarinae (strain DSM 45818 / CECT 9043 / HFP020203 / CcI3) TaxID=106370 RepID=Q2J799_FRACC|nr:Molybdopterin-guanine dinucleotide biosynthesis protein A-like [Frankia casuarinae]
MLAGGGARRLGGRDKPAVMVGGSTLLERVLSAVLDAERVVIVGPRRDLAVDPIPPGRVRWCREDPPGGGPVAAIAAGLVEITTPFVAVLAADLPFLTGREIALLRRGVADPAAQAALLVDPDGRRQFLAAVWRTASLWAALPADPIGRPVRGLFADRPVTAVRAHARTCLDCDEPADVARARSWAAVGERGPARHDRPMTSADDQQPDHQSWSDHRASADPPPPEAGRHRPPPPEAGRHRPPPAAAVGSGAGNVRDKNVRDKNLLERDVLAQWVSDVCAELGLDAARIDVGAVLDLARDVAHGVARPAAPLTAFLVGLAAGRNAGGAHGEEGGGEGGTDGEREAAAARAATSAVLGLLARARAGTGPAQPIRPGPASSR